MKMFFSQTFCNLRNFFLPSFSFVSWFLFKFPRSLTGQRCVPVQPVLNPKLRAHPLRLFSLLLQEAPPPPETGVAFPNTSPPVWRRPTSRPCSFAAPLLWVVPKLGFSDASGKRNSVSFQEKLLANAGCNCSAETCQRCQRACGHGGVWYGIWGGSGTAEEPSWPRTPLTSQPAIYLGVCRWSSYRWTKQRGYVTSEVWVFSSRGWLIRLNVSLEDSEGASSTDPNQQHPGGALQ